MKSKYVHSLIFLLFLLIFSFYFINGFVVYGDFATTFSYKSQQFLNLFKYSWLGNSFLGYESSFYNFLRFPFYLLSDLINLTLGYNFWWFFFVLIYFFRYYLFYRLLKYYKVNDNFAILIGLIYSFNFYFIDRLGHTYISFASIAIPLLVLSYSEISRRISVKSLLLFFLSLWIIFSSMHVALMTFYFLILFFLFQLLESNSYNKLSIFLKNNLIIFILTFFLFSFIFIPLGYNFFLSNQNLISQVGSLSSEEIFFYSKLTHLPLPLIGLGFYYSELLNYTLIIFLGLIFLIIFLYFIFFSQNKPNVIYFYIIVFLCFGFLSSITLLEPYIPFLKHYLIGFNSIKDTSYFILYTVFSLFVALGLSLSNYTQHIKKIKIFLIMVLIFFLITNLFALGSFKVFQTSKIPKPYYNIDKYIDENKRVLILPLGWISKFEWSNNEIMSGFFNIFYANLEIVGQNIIEGPSLTTQNKINSFNDCFVVDCINLDKEFNELNLRYIINFKGSKSEIGNTFLNYSDTINRFLSSKDIKQLIGNEYYEIFIITNPDLISSKIYSKNLIFQKINPTKYNIYIKNLDEKQDLSFLESYHENWKLYLKKNSSSSWCIPIEYYNNTQTTECQHEQKFFEGEELNYLWKKPIFDNSHKMVYDYANSWTIDSAYIKEHYSSDYYTLNSDGSINVELVMYFKPQSYFYLGLLISITTLVLCIAYLVWDWKRGRKQKTLNTTRYH